MGATFAALAPGHPIARKAASTNPALARFIENCQRSSTAEADLETTEKLGIPTGLYAINPFTGTNIPIWVANFVVMSYGTGAIMSVPAHDQRDHEFAKKYDLPIKQVIVPTDNTEIDIDAAAWSGKGILQDSGDFTGLTSAEAFETGGSRANATGGHPSQSSIPKPPAQLAYRKTSCR